MLFKNAVDTVSEKKQELIDDFNNGEFNVGERIGVSDTLVSNYPKNKNVDATIRKVDEANRELTVVQGDGSTYKTEYTISFDDVEYRDVFRVGADPFKKTRSHLRFVAFSLDSILFQLNIIGEEDRDNRYDIGGVLTKQCNWNPFVFLPNGEKRYYQRPLVWELKEKQLLLDSIYNDIDIGKVVVRKRSWQELENLVELGETEIAFHDIVDGKQRLNAIGEFIRGEYPDSHGNYFADLSAKAQHQFTSNQLLSYAEMPENTPDEAVLEQFLKLNFTGVPQSEDHINFVQSLYKNYE